MPICSKTEATLRPRREGNPRPRRERNVKGNRAQGNLFCVRESPRGSVIAADAAAIVGGKIAHSTVSEQLAQERIDVPPVRAASRRPRQGVAGGASSLRRAEAHNRPRAKAFADHCIRQHMLEASGGAAPAEADKAGRVRRRGVSQGSSPSDLENPAAAYML